MEGADPVKFLGTLLPKLLQLQLSHVLEIDRAYRVPAHTKITGKYPRPMILRVLRYQQTAAIMATAKVQSPITHEGRKLMFFPDFSSYSR